VTYVFNNSDDDDDDDNNDDKIRILDLVACYVLIPVFEKISHKIFILVVCYKLCSVILEWNIQRTCFYQ